MEHDSRRTAPCPRCLPPACSPDGFTQVPQKPSCVSKDGKVQVTHP